MEIVIHAGTHKTATTQFQSICYENKTLLEKHGVLYPEINFIPKKRGSIDWPKDPRSIRQHSFLQRMARTGDNEDLGRFFRESVKSAKAKNCDLILLSGEDMESALIDNSIAHAINSQAKEAGLESIRWIFVKRKSCDYFQSLYSQLARQRFVCSPLSLLTQIESNGFAVIGNRYGVFHFVFDLSRRCELMERNFGTPVKMINFEDFVASGHAGVTLLSEICRKNLSGLINYSGVDTKKTNKSMDPQSREILYICAYLGVEPSQEIYEQNLNLFNPLIEYRVKEITNCINRAKASLAIYD